VALHISDLSTPLRLLSRACIAATLALASARLRSQPGKCGASAGAGGAARTAIVKVAGTIKPTNATDATAKRLSTALFGLCCRFCGSSANASRQRFEQ